VYVFVFDTKGRLLIQKRSADKKIGPNQWDLSVAEHLSAGEKSIKDQALSGEKSIKDQAWSPNCSHACCCGNAVICGGLHGADGLWLFGQSNSSMACMKPAGSGAAAPVAEVRRLFPGSGADICKCQVALQTSATVALTCESWSQVISQALDAAWRLYSCR
jgi:hypothetical protein